MRIANVQTLLRRSDAFGVSKKPRGAPVQRTVCCCRRVTAATLRRVKIATALAAVSALLYALVCALPVEETSAALTEWIRSHRSAGFIVFPLIYWLLIPLCIPASMIDVIGGSVFGMSYGILLNTIGKTGGALLAFALGKRLGRARVGNYLETNFPMFTAVATILESDSWKPLLLVQLSTLPHAVKSYGLAITNVSTYRFIVSSFVTALPFTVLLTQIGSQTQEMFAHSHASTTNATDATDATDATSSAATETALMVIGLLVTVGTMVFFVVYTKREINRQLAKVGALDKRTDDGSSNASVTVVVCATDNCGDNDAMVDDDVEEEEDFDLDNATERLLPALHATSCCSSSSSSKNIPKQRSSVT